MEIKEHYGFIYLIRNKINNKIYIGQTTQGFNKRYGGNISNTHNEYLKNSIYKYGIENFEIDEEFDIAYSKEELDKLECLYISAYNTTNRNFGYNRKTGGANGKPNEDAKQKNREKHLSILFSEEHKKKISDAHKGDKNYWYGKQRSDEFKDYLSKLYKGKKNPMGLSEETKQKISKAKSGKKNPMYGKHHTEEAKKKISENKKENYLRDNHPMYGKHHTEETKKKLSEINKKNSLLSIKVICITTNKIFNSIKDASKLYSCDNTSISKCCKGKLKSCGYILDENGEKIRLKWMYYDEWLKLQNEIA